MGERQPQPAASKKQRTIALCGLGLNALIIVGVLFYDSRLKNVEQQAQYVTRPNYVWLALACLLGVLLLETVSLCYACAANGRPVGFWKTLHVAIVGRYYGALIPGGFSQPLQIHSLTQEGIPGGIASALILMRTSWQQGIFFLAGLTAMLWLGGDLFATSKIMFFAAIAAMLLWFFMSATLLVMAIKSNWLVKLLNGLRRLLEKLRLARLAQGIERWAEEGIRAFKEGVHEFRSPGLNAVMAASLAGQLILTLLIPVCVFLAFGTPGSATVALIGKAQLVTMVMVVVPLPGAAGGAEGSFLTLFHDYFAPNILLIAMLFWRLFTYYGYVIIGAGDMLVDVVRRSLAVRKARRS